jgi:hypothetical protein
MTEPTEVPPTSESTPDAASPVPSPSAAASTAALEAAKEGAAAAEHTPFALARKLVAEKVPRAEALARLCESGLDEEAAKVALNAVDGKNPSELPDATLAPGINPLAPGRFALSDIGLSGHPATVGLYWMAFGAVVLVLATAFVLLPEFGIGEASPASHFWARVGLFLGAGAFGWGLLRLLTGIRVRRRP